MNYHKLCHYFSPKWALSLLFWLCLGLCYPIRAQIIPDNTLNNENSVIVPQQGFDKIDGGALRGSNLFHSFQEFNINLGQSVYFSNPDFVTNILTRVTGNNPSNIFGTLGVLGPANFYLINPHGIIFGNNSHLDIQGSFTATTTPAIRIGDQLFSATNPDTSALLNIQPEVLFPNSLSQLADISNNGNLTVNEGQNITLIGNTITQNGLLKAPAGEIKIIGDKILLTSLSETNTSSSHFGGTILLGGNQQGTGNFPLASMLEIAPNALINASAMDMGDGGKVIAWSSNLTHFYGSIFAQGGENGGDGGFVEVSGKNNLVFRGDVNTLAPLGNAGTLLIDPTNILIKAGTGDGNDNGSSMFAFGDNITGNNGQVLRSDSVPTILYQSELEWLSGSKNIVIQADNDIIMESLSNGYLDVSPGIGTISFIADADSNGVGSFSMLNTNNVIYTEGRNIFIQGASINVGSIDTYNYYYSTGKTGSINLVSTNGAINVGLLDTSAGYNTGNIDLTANNGAINVGSLDTSAYDHTGDINLTAKGTNGTINIVNQEIDSTSYIGQAGNVHLIAEGNSSTIPAILLKNTYVDLESSGTNGQTGNMTVEADNGLIQLISSTQSDSIFARTLASSPLARGQKRGGDILMNGKNITIDGYYLTVGSTGNTVADGGTINLIADNNLTLINQSILRAYVGNNALGNGGNITLQGNSILINNLSEINTGSNGNGHGGDITISAHDLNISNQSSLYSSPNSQGDGGNIRLNGLNDGNITLDNSKIYTANPQSATANSGSIEIVAGKINIQNQSIIRSDTLGLGNGGNISISANDVRVINNSQFYASTLSGHGGNILLQILNGGNFTLDNSKIYTTTSGKGEAGSIDIIAGIMNIKNNSRIEASTFGIGNSGNISLNTSRQGNIFLDSSYVLSAGYSSSQGNAGLINIVSGYLKLNNTSTLIVSSFGNGSAGNVNILLTDLTLNNSLINASTSKGNGGSINIDSANNLILNNSSFINASTHGIGDTGNISINANNNLILNNFSFIDASTLGDGNAGNINIYSANLTVKDRSGISSAIMEEGKRGNGGNITLLIPNQTILDNSIIETIADPKTYGNSGNILLNSNYIFFNESTISTGTNGFGDAGNLAIYAGNNLRLDNLSSIDASTTGNGNGGNINIHSGNDLTLNHESAIVASTFGNGNGGSINIYSPNLTLETMSLISSSVLKTSGNQANGGNISLIIPNQTILDDSIIATMTDPNTYGNSGNILLNSLSIHAFNNSMISTETNGFGDAGNLAIYASNDLRLNNYSFIKSSTSGEGDGGTIQIYSPNELSLNDQSGIDSSAFANGQGGNILINSDSPQGTVTLSNGAFISAVTSGRYSGGSIELYVANLHLNNDAEITAIAWEGSSGQAGNISITSDQILLENSSRFAVNSQGLGQGGNIDVIANNLTLYNQGIINAETLSNQGGNINLNIADLLTMRYGSKITATAGTAGAGGDGGNININANFIVGLPNEDSDITANAFEGNGGQINITTNGIFGLQFRPLLTPLSDITASSEFGLSGTVSILTPNVNPAQGLTELPSNLVDASQLIGQNACAFEGGKIGGGSSFTVTGKGGLPPSPTESLTLVFGLVNWSDLGDTLAQNQQENLVASQNLSHLIVAEGDLEKQAFDAYQSGNYQESIHLLMTLKNKETNPIKQVKISNNLALNYQQLGDWKQSNTFLQDSFAQLNTVTNSSEKDHLLSEILDIQAQGELMTGNYQNALDIWKKVSQIYQNQTNSPELIRSEINQILALKAMGSYTQANYQIQQLLLKNQDFNTNKSLKVKVLILQGEIARLTGNYKLSEDYLQEALKLSSDANKDDIILSLGNTDWFSKKPDDALIHYQEVEKSSSNSKTKLQAKLNQLNLLVQEKKSDLALKLLPSVQENLDTLHPNHNNIYALLNLATNLDKLGQLSQSLSYLQTALSQAQAINDTRSQSYALGFLGHIYEEQKDYEKAKIMTQNALSLSHDLQADDLSYQWEWQMGRINKQQGNLPEAINAYQQSINSLKSIRGDLVAISSDVQFSFREEVEPIYRELADLLLQPNASQEQLNDARNVIESLQLAELDNFFRDACLNTQSVQIDQVDKTASIIYSIILGDRVEVIASFPTKGLVHYSIPMTPTQLKNIADSVISNLTNSRRSIKQSKGLENLKFLYDSLVRPLEPYLQENKIKTLVFVNDGVFRKIPFSALYDGEHYLIEKYAVNVAPSLNLVQSQPLSKDRLAVLAGGLSKSVQGFLPLENVDDELNNIKKQASTTILLDEQFTSTNLEQSFQKVPFSVVHFATHGEFSSKADETFLLLWDKKLNINELNQLLRQDNQNNSSIDLLVLSACKTATGDSRATLGLAGMAVRAGAKSTLASLWYVSDVSTSLLMTNFYQFLATGQYTKAEAFRQAQLQVLQDSRFAHPYYWSAFVLLGNWL